MVKQPVSTRFPIELALVSYRIPTRVWVDGPLLRHHFEPRKNKLATGSPELLEQFARLHVAEDEEIAAFARRHGLLATGTRTVGWEPLVLWREISAEAQAILEHAADLFEDSPYPPSIETHRALCAQMERWIKDRSFICFRIETDWNLSVLRPQWEGRGLAAALAIEMIRVLLNAGAVLRCDHCAKPYRTERAARADRRHYCPACRANHYAAVKASDRRAYRPRRRVKERT